jgi:hypothetical protein
MSIPPAPCAEHGFHPGQCTISFGVMADPEPFMMAYVRRLDDAGFTIHIHASPKPGWTSRFSTAN